MSEEDIKFDTNEDILLQIAMKSYAKHNDKLCSINEYLGEIYSYKDLVDAEELQQQYEKHLGEIAIKQLQQENKQLKSILIELEEWLNRERNDDSEYSSYERFTAFDETLDKIQELKEKYK